MQEYWRTEYWRWHQSTLHVVEIVRQDCLYLKSTEYTGSPLWLMLALMWLPIENHQAKRRMRSRGWCWDLQWRTIKIISADRHSFQGREGRVNDASPSQLQSKYAKISEGISQKNSSSSRAPIRSGRESIHTGCAYLRNHMEPSDPTTYRTNQHMN